MTSWSGVGVTSITLQFDLSRNIDAAAAGRAARRSMRQAACCPRTCPPRRPIRKVNPANFAVLIYAIHSDAVAALQGRRIRQQRHRRPAVDRARGGAGLRLRLEALCRPRPDQPGGACSAGTRPRRCAQCADRRNSQQSERRDRGRASGHRARYQRSAVQRRAVRQRHHRLQERRAGADQGRRRRHQLGAEHPAPLMVRRPAGGGHRHPESPGRQHDRRGRPDQGVDAQARAVAAAGGPCRPDVGPVADDPRCRSATCNSRCC